MRTTIKQYEKIHYIAEIVVNKTHETCVKEGAETCEGKSGIHSMVYVVSVEMIG